MEIAIIGAGLIGRRRLAAALQLEQIKRVHLFDVDIERMEHLVSSFSTDRIIAADHLDSILHNREISAGIVATVHSSLAPIAASLLKSGKHTLVEKPGGIRLEEILELTSIAESRRLCLRFGFNHRFHPSVLKARGIVQRGNFGEVLWVRGQYGHGGRLGYEKEWRAKRSVSGGGELIDQGSHLIDLTQFLCGPCNLQYSTLATSFWDIEVEDNAFFCLKIQNGGIAWHHASWTEWKNRFSFEICLRTAKLEITGLGGSYGQEELKLYVMDDSMSPPALETETWQEADGSWLTELSDFLGVIDGAEGLGADSSQTCDLFKILQDAYRS